MQSTAYRLPPSQPNIQCHLWCQLVYTVPHGGVTPRSVEKEPFTHLETIKADLGNRSRKAKRKFRLRTRFPFLRDEEVL